MYEYKGLINIKKHFSFGRQVNKIVKIIPIIACNSYRQYSKQQFLCVLRFFLYLWIPSHIIQSSVS